MEFSSWFGGDAVYSRRSRGLFRMASKARRPPTDKARCAPRTRGIEEPEAGDDDRPFLFLT
jgi:hypothetical protein